MRKFVNFMSFPGVWMRRYVAGCAVTVMALTFAASEVAAQETDRTKVFYNMANSLGMLRTVNELDSAMTLEAWARGTRREVTAKGVGPEEQLKSYYMQFAYDFPGMRVETVSASGERQIQVVSGTYAWNEIDKIGGGLEPGWGSAVPAMDAVTPRLLRLWMSPMGAVKAARAAGDQAKITVEGGRTVVTFPLINGKPEQTVHMVVGQLNGTTMKVTLDAMYRPARVEATYMGRAYVASYSEYGDLNEADYKADIFMPRRTVVTLDGQTILDLTIDKTNTYNPYVIMPVPPNVQKVAGK